MLSGNSDLNEKLVNVWNRRKRSVLALVKRCVVRSAVESVQPGAGFAEKFLRPKKELLNDLQRELQDIGVRAIAGQKSGREFAVTSCMRN